MQRTFFIADTHFNHERIIPICNRPFKSVEEMNNSLIERWNDTVRDCDMVWILGDFFYFRKCPEGIEPWSEEDLRIKSEDSEMCADILSRLNGIRYLIMGNHDIRDDDQYREIGFYFVSPYPILLNNFYLLSHEPLQLSETTPYFNVYGHVHNDNKYQDNETSKCVSVERIDYKPIQLF